MFTGISNYIKSHIIGNQRDKLGIVLFDVAAEYQLLEQQEQDLTTDFQRSRIPQFPGALFNDFDSTKTSSKT